MLVATLGTGIGTALIHDGVLVPNTELGHLELDGHDAETRASDAARDRDDLTGSSGPSACRRYFSHVEALFWPDLIVVGGGVSKKSAKFLPHAQVAHARSSRPRCSTTRASSAPPCSPPKRSHPARPEF